MILITRPKPEAEKLSLELSKLHKITHIESLLTFYHYKKKLNFNKVTDIIITSTQSVIALKKNNQSLSPKFKSLCFYVVGNNVAFELKKLGCKKIKKVFLNSRELIQHLKNQNLDERLFYYLSGDIVNGHLVKSLTRLKIDFKRMVLYRSRVKVKLSNKVLDLIQTKEIKIVLLYSSFTALSFIRLIRKASMTRHAKNLTYICLSSKIAKLMKTNKFNKVMFAHKPTQQSLLQTIRKI